MALSSKAPPADCGVCAKGNVLLGGRLGQMGGGAKSSFMCRMWTLQQWQQKRLLLLRKTQVGSLSSQ